MISIILYNNEIMINFFKKYVNISFLPWILVVILTVYSVFVSMFYYESDYRLKALQKFFAPNFTQDPVLLSTAKPLINPYQGNIGIENQILKDLDYKTTDIKILNIMSNHAYISEHAKSSGGGGGWCVLYKENEKWRQLFCSQDEAYCFLYHEYNLPKGLLGECSI